MIRLWIRQLVYAGNTSASDRVSGNPFFGDINYDILSSIFYGIKFTLPQHFHQSFLQFTTWFKE